MRIRATIDFDVEDEVLRAHISESEGAKPPYTDDFEEWDGADLFALEDMGAIERGEVEVYAIEEIAPVEEA